MIDKDEKGNALANIIRIADNLKSIAVDSIDGYATPEQAKRAIQNCIGQIVKNLNILGGSQC